MPSQSQDLSDALIIPHEFVPRDYQVPFLYEVEKAILGQSHKRFFIQVWHRRSGKDKTGISTIAPKRLIQDPCLVKYVYPTLVMGRDNLWEGIGGDGFKYLDHLPEGMRAGHANSTRMTIPIKTKWGGGHNSIFQISGSDNPDSLRGGNPKMFIFSEWSEQDPYAWDVVRPILEENNGIAVFNFTPRGDNHAASLIKYARSLPEPNPWHVQILTAEDTGVFSMERLVAIRADLIAQFVAQGRSEDEAIAYFEQEYMCSFDAPVIGSYYGANMRLAEAEGRVGRVPYERALPVHTAWDLGMDDSMTIWFFQVYGLETRIIDYYESSGEGLAHYANVLQDRKYVYGMHIAPHDIAVRELGTGKSRKEVARSLGINFTTAPMLEVEDGINAVRSMLGGCWFDAEKCKRGINCLKSYRKDWDEKNKVFRLSPKHDWASHGADAFRILATGYKRPVYRKPPSIDPGGVRGDLIPGVG